MGSPIITKKERMAAKKKTARQKKNGHEDLWAQTPDIIRAIERRNLMCRPKNNNPSHTRLRKDPFNYQLIE